MKGFGKSKNGNFEVIGSAKGPDGQNALLVGCKVNPNDLEHPGYMNSELRRYLDDIKEKAKKENFNGFVFKKQF